MTIKIGRFGIDLAAGEVASWDESGSSCKVSGYTGYSDASEAVILRQQLQGYVDAADESFVPVTWDEMPSIDGFYRVKDASVEARASIAPQGVMDFSVSLERVGGFAAPMIESTVVGKTRAQLASTRFNYLKNPSGRRSLTGYSSLGASAPALDPGVGSYVIASGVTPAGNTGISVGTLTVGTDLAGNGSYTFSASILGSNCAVQLFVVGSGKASGGTSPVKSAGGPYARVEAAFVTAASGTLTFYVLNGSPTTAASSISFQDAQVEFGSSATPYFDGTTSVLPMMVNTWTGTADNSVSSSVSTVLSLPSAGVPGPSRSVVSIERITGAINALPTGPGFSVEGGTAKVLTGSYDQFALQSYVAPADFYQAAATLTMGSPLRVVTGRQIRNTPTLWLLSNGLFRIRPMFGSGLGFEVSNWASGAWSAWETLTFTFKDGGVGYNFIAPHSITVLRNGPEAVTIRLLLTQSTGGTGDTTDGPVTFDITLRRGHEFVSVEMRSLYNQDNLLAVQGFSAAIPVNHGWTLPSSGVFVLSPRPLTAPTSSLGLYNSADPKSISLGIGKTASTVSTSSWWNPYRSIRQYFWAGNETVNVVKR